MNPRLSPSGQTDNRIDDRRLNRRRHSNEPGAESIRSTLRAFSKFRFWSQRIAAERKGGLRVQ
jgi:hypothetical protein